MPLYPTRAPRFGLCFDFETSGSDWGSPNSAIDYQGISLGLVVFETRTFDIIAEDYFEIKFDATKYKWSKDAEKIHGLTQEFLEEFGLTKEEAACRVIEFMLKYFGPNPNVMVCGHNIGYDIKFMHQLLDEFELMFNIHHVRLDTAAAEFIAFTTYKSDDLFDLLCNGKRDTHNALEDCRMTLEAAKNMRLLFEAAING
jgi:oligoribonuclease (3'-5' exoribonuclease)